MQNFRKRVGIAARNDSGAVSKNCKAALSGISEVRNFIIILVKDFILNKLSKNDFKQNFKII